MHYVYICNIVFKKVHIGIVLWICSYFIVIAGLPLHHHASDNDVHTCEQDPYTQKDHNKKDSSHDDCIICLHLHVPNAIIDFATLDYSSVSIDIIRLPTVMKPIYWESIQLFNLANKDPPLSIVN